MVPVEILAAGSQMANRIPTGLCEHATQLGLASMRPMPIDFGFAVRRFFLTL